MKRWQLTTLTLLVMTLFPGIQKINDRLQAEDQILTFITDENLPDVTRKSSLSRIFFFL